ncbi:MAG: RHS repeat-associated core domain-containing protein [Bacteroidota bacterium]
MKLIKTIFLCVGLTFMSYVTFSQAAFQTETIFACATETSFSVEKNYNEICNNNCDDTSRGCPDSNCGNCDKYLEKLDASAPISLSSAISFRDQEIAFGIIIQVKDKTKHTITVTDPDWFGETVIREYSTRTEVECIGRLCLDRRCATRNPDHVRDYIIKRYKKNLDSYADITGKTIVAVKNAATESVSFSIPMKSNKKCRINFDGVGSLLICDEPVNPLGSEYQDFTLADEYFVELFRNGSWQRIQSGTGNPPSSLSLSISGLDFGSYQIRVRQLADCNGSEAWIQQGTVEVVPSCFNDNLASFRVGGAARELLPNFPNSYLIEATGTYPILLSGLSDFNEHYELSLDGEREYIRLNAEDRTITVLNDIGNIYKLFVSRKPGRETCLSSVPEDPNGNAILATITIMVNGEPLEVEDFCPVTLPDDLTGTTGEDEDNVFIAEIFPVEARSARRVIVKPGVVLSSGATLSLKVLKEDEGLPVSNESENFVMQKTYDDFGLMTGATMTYFDDMGRTEQNQYIDIRTGKFLTSEQTYDDYGRSMLSTLTAPVGENPEDIDCPGFSLQENGVVAFQKETNFARTVDNQALDEQDLTRGNAVAVGSGVDSPLGRYYSENSEEPLMAMTEFPFVQEVPRNDGTGEMLSSVPPGDYHRLGSTPDHVAITEQQRVDPDPTSIDNEFLGEYLAIFTEVFPDRLMIADSLRKSLSKVAFTDADGRESYTYTDQEGQTIISTLRLADGWLKAFDYFDTKGRMVAMVTPNGVRQYDEGISYADIDKTTYEYNFEGLLLASNEPDAGRSEYRYARDGRIRFSQNAAQRERGAFSYTNYDQAVRPIESGEFTPGSGSEYTWDSPQLLALLDLKGVVGEIPKSEGATNYVMTTSYDLPATLPDGYGSLNQGFVMGAVSYTQYAPDGEQPTISSYFSYDERGRTKWVLQDIRGLGVKQIQYNYTSTGEVKEVAYQRGQSDAYYHYYEYDADTRLSRVYSGIIAPIYDSQEEITNRNQLTHQAGYDYYLTGPLKEITLPQINQKQTYTYTVDGKLKGINWNTPSGLGQSETVEDDAFGMVLDYHANDYQSAAISPSPLAVGKPDQYSGSIKAQQWHSPVDGNQTKVYAYEYDQRQQLTSAQFGSVSPSNGGGQGEVFNSTNDYHVEISDYDENGNIKALVRNRENGQVLHDLSYYYTPNKNKLDSVYEGGKLFGKYEYDKIGRLIYRWEGNQSFYYDYNVMDLVTGVYRDQAMTQPILINHYDEKGFRLSKTAYDTSNYQPTFRTWYVRDVSGAEMSVYVENLRAESEPVPYEVPIWGASRLGFYRSVEQMNLYEFKDHLSNVRTVIGAAETVNYLATMEDARESEEAPYFELTKVVTVASHLNHTADVNASKAVRINNVLDADKNPIGAGQTLSVFTGDTIRAKVYAKYEDFNNSSNTALPLLADYLSTTFRETLPLEGANNVFGAIDQPSFLSMATVGTFNDQQPRMYLNYMLFSHDFELLDYGFDQVTEAARIPTDGTLLESHPFEELNLEIPISQPGFLYVYVSNENQENVTAYFDDLSVDHTLSPVTFATDYYPFGLPMAGREHNSNGYRKGYQGEWTENDEETGEVQFQLRMYSPILGRFLTVDPERQFASGYVGMGNNPVIATDPTGGRSPIYDQDGNFLGVDSEGFTGDILIMDENTFNLLGGNGLDHDVAMSAGTLIRKAGLSPEAAANVFTHVLGQMIDAPNAQSFVDNLYNGSVSTFNTTDYRDLSGQFNDPYVGGSLAYTQLVDGQIKVSANIRDYSVFGTVEDVQNILGVHEYYGHGVLGIGKNNGHSKAYELQFQHHTYHKTTRYFRNYMERSHAKYVSEGN